MKKQNKTWLEFYVSLLDNGDNFEENLEYDTHHLQLLQLFVPDSIKGVIHFDLPMNEEMPDDIILKPSKIHMPCRLVGTYEDYTFCSKKVYLHRTEVLKKLSKGFRYD